MGNVCAILAGQVKSAARLIFSLHRDMEATEMHHCQRGEAEQLKLAKSGICLHLVCPTTAPCPTLPQTL